MAMSSKLLIAIAGAALLTACQSHPLPQAGSLDAAWGEASKYNAAVQTINPEPVYTAQDAQPGDNGEKMANAVKRYRTDKVKPTEPARTTTSSQGGGSSGGSSGPR
jgi:hypothetical protein